MDEEYIKKSDIIELCDRVVENLKIQQERETDPGRNLINEVAITSINTIEASILCLSRVQLTKGE